MTTLPTMMVVDASVALKWFRSKEDGAIQALLLLDRHAAEQIQLCAPSLLVCEVVNALRFKPDLNEDDILEIQADLTDADLEFFPPGREMLTRAIRISFGFRDARGKSPTIYDACYVALAELLKCRMITADRRLLGQLQGHPLVVPLGGVI